MNVGERRRGWNITDLKSFCLDLGDNFVGDVIEQRWLSSLVVEVVMVQ